MRGGRVRGAIRRLLGVGDGGAPPQVVAAVSPARGERLLAATEVDDGAWVVGTDRRVLLVAGDGVAVDRPWWQVDAATWDDQDAVLSVRWVDGRTAWWRPREPASPVTRRFLAVARERVDATVVAVHQVQVPGRGGARLVARRVDGRVVLQVLPDAGTDLADPAVVAAVEQGRLVLADQVGPLG